MKAGKVKKLCGIMLFFCVLISSCVLQSANDSTNSALTQAITPSEQVATETNFLPSQQPGPTPTAVPFPPVPAHTGSTAPSLPDAPVSNKVYMDNSTYVFEYKDASGTVKYLYKPETGSLHDLIIRVGNDPSFYPSSNGGPVFVHDSQEVPLWQPTEDLTITHAEPVLNGDSLEVTWTVRFGEYAIPYTYRFSIRGKTLQVEFFSSSRDIAAVALDRSENTPGAQLIQVPYLSDMSVLLYKSYFMTAYFDWLQTNSSGIYGLGGKESNTSYYFGQHELYQPATNGLRNQMHEIAYFTVSNKLAEVLPNIPNNSSPYRATLSNYIVVDLWSESFSWTTTLVNTLHQKGITNLFLIKHVWQKCNYDDCYPDVIPAQAALGGDSGMKELSAAARNAGYLFALHENYVDAYADSIVWNPKLIALDPKGDMTLSWYNDWLNIQSYLLSPVYALETAARYSPVIHEQYGTSATFLDVTSCVLPSAKVDFNANIVGAGLFSTTFDAYSRLMAYERSVHGGPVMGEGGNHFIYAGLIDSAEARITPVSDSPYYGPDTQPVVDFDLLKIHPLSLNYGMGYYANYFVVPKKPTSRPDFDPSLYSSYMAREIAFCHAGFVPDPGDIEEGAWLAYVERVVKLILPIQQKCALASVSEISYNVNGKMVGVEEALRDNNAWQVHVAYDSGLQVYVNTNHSKNWEVTPSGSQSWVDYAAIVNGQRKEYVGFITMPTYTIPPDGWLVFMP